jgi:hypothetical protein
VGGPPARPPPPPPTRPAPRAPRPAPHAPTPRAPRPTPRAPRPTPNRPRPGVQVWCSAGAWESANMPACPSLAALAQLSPPPGRAAAAQGLDPGRASHSSIDNGGCASFVFTSPLGTFPLKGVGEVELIRCSY